MGLSTPKYVRLAAVTLLGVGAGTLALTRLYKAQAVTATAAPKKGTHDAIVRAVNLPDLGLADGASPNAEAEAKPAGLETLQKPLADLIAQWKTVRATNEHESEATSIEDLMKKSGLTINSLRPGLVDAIRKGNPQAFRFALNLFEQAVEGHGFRLEYTFRKNNSFLDLFDSDQKYPATMDEKALTIMHDRRAGEIQKCFLRWGIDYPIYAANDIALDLLDAENDPATIAENLADFYENAQEQDARKKMIEILLHATGWSRQQLTAQVKAGVAFMTNQPPESSDAAEPNGANGADDQNEIETVSPLENLKTFYAYLAKLEQSPPAP